MSDSIFDPSWYVGRTVYVGGDMKVTDRGWGGIQEATASPLIAHACSTERDPPMMFRVAPWARILGATGSVGRGYQAMPPHEWQKVLATFRGYGGYDHVDNMGDLLNYGPAREDEPWPWETLIDYRGASFHMADNQLSLGLRQMMMQNLGYDGFLVSCETELFSQHPGYGSDPVLWEALLAEAFGQEEVFPVLAMFNIQALLPVEGVLPAVSAAHPFPDAPEAFSEASRS